MKDSDFNDLCASVREAGEMRRTMDNKQLIKLCKARTGEVRDLLREWHDRSPSDSLQIEQACAQLFVIDAILQSLIPDAHFSRPVNKNPE